MWRNILAACWLTILSIWDIRYKKVPVWMLGTGAAAAGAALLYEIAEAAFDPISICIAMLPGAVLMTAALYTDHAGWGDGIVMLILGASLKREESLLAFCAGLGLAALFSLSLLVLRRADRKTRLPFLPFLALGMLICIIGKGFLGW
ncbi:MAG: hypothetical protein HFG25_13660 [Lachnospiraceae bacterium]|nr:hypothetical protein [Lachnospiraceae bacterium]